MPLSVRNLLLAIAGFILLAVGAVGIVVPIWPTTPFIIVAAGCFAATPSLHKFVMKIPFVCEYIRNYEQGTGIPRRTVAISLSFLWVMLAVSSFAVRIAWVICLLAVVGIAVTIHILCVAKPRKKTKKCKEE
jgi:uncharacterized membrane protein YbaN (DUF454 family)